MARALESQIRFSDSVSLHLNWCVQIHNALRLSRGPREGKHVKTSHEIRRRSRWTLKSSKEAEVHMVRERKLSCQLQWRDVMRQGLLVVAGGVPRSRPKTVVMTVEGWTSGKKRKGRRGRKSWTRRQNRRALERGLEAWERATETLSQLPDSPSPPASPTESDTEVERKPRCAICRGDHWTRLHERDALDPKGRFGMFNPNNPRGPPPYLTANPNLSGVPESSSSRTPAQNLLYDASLRRVLREADEETRSPGNHGSGSSQVSDSGHTKKKRKNKKK